MSQPTEVTPSLTMSEASRKSTQFRSTENNGATILKQPQKAFWVDTPGIFPTPTGHTWEIAYNPFWLIQKDGRVSMKKE